MQRMTLIIPVGEKSVLCVSDEGEKKSSHFETDADDDSKSKDLLDLRDNPALLKRYSYDGSPLKGEEGFTGKLKRSQGMTPLSRSAESPPPSPSSLLIYECSISIESIPKYGSLSSESSSRSDASARNSEKSKLMMQENAIQRELSYSSSSSPECLKKTNSSSQSSEFHQNISRVPLVVPPDEGNNSLVIREKSGEELDSTESLEGSFVRRMRLKKLMQRRTVSESHSRNFDFEKSKERLRHSFSSYEYCDNLVSETSAREHDTLLVNEQNFFSLDANTFGSQTNDAIKAGSRRSCIEISDTLVNSVKKSMIEEYQNLKKKNSSFSCDSNLSSPSDASNLVEQYKRFSGSSVCDNHSKEPLSCSETIQNETEMKNNPSSYYENGTLQRSNSCFNNGSNFESNCEVTLRVEDKLDRSSPPSRLESWKNLLAEKRNSIKNHLKGINRGTDDSLKSKESHNKENQSNISESEDFINTQLNETYAKDHVPSTCNLSDNFSDNASVNNNKAVSTQIDDEHSPKVISRLEEACQNIAKAFYVLPAITNSDTLNNNTNNERLENDIKNIVTEEVITSQDNILSNTESIICNEKPTLYTNREPSTISSIITAIKPPVITDLFSNEKTPISLEQKGKAEISTSEEDSDYCQTDECGDDCDYCSGGEAEDEEDEPCDLCRKNRSSNSSCKHTRVITNGSLNPLRRHRLSDENGSHRMSGSSSRSLVLQAALRRRRLNSQELYAIREYSITSDEQLDSDEEQSQDDSMCDLSSSWRFGLCREPVTSREPTLRSNRNARSLPPKHVKEIAKLKSNSLPAAPLRLSSEINRIEASASKPFCNSDDEEIYASKSRRVRRPPRAPKGRLQQFTCVTSPPRPAMGLQGLQQRPSSSRLASLSSGPKTLVPRSPVNPNPPFGFPSPTNGPITCPGSPSRLRKSPVPIEKPTAPSSPRTNIRSGALVTRNFSISDDEGGQRMSRRQVTITRHEKIYKEAAEKGYTLPPSSPVDPYWLTWKLGVLQKTTEEVSSRLEECEKVFGSFGPIPQDSNLADQHVHNVRKFRENLPDLQRGIDDVNDQVARFSAHNVPLTSANSAALHDLNNRWKNLETSVNDRWRQLAGRSREVTPLTPAQLASSVCPPWERAVATNKVPYYINHAQETTNWDHPDMIELLDSLSEYNHIKFSAYRTASKLRSLQKKLSLDRAKLQMVTDVFDEHGLRGQNDRLIDINDMVVVLSTLYGRIASDTVDIDKTLVTDLCLNWLLNVYDSQRTGQMRVLSFRIGLVSLCRGHLEEKYRYMFRLIADPNRLVDQRKLGLLLHDCVQVPRQLGEVAAFGGSNIEPSVRSCFTKAGKDKETIEAVHFLSWVQQEPQSLVWLAVLHRMAASESVQHQVKCNICKTYPIVGLRYRCLKCLSFDMCQRCFFDGRSSKSHKITHPMHEYCTGTTAGDEMKDFTKALKNKFKSKRSLQKHTKKGYLPVQTVLEGDRLESPSPSPSHNVSSQDMHSRLEIYASRLAEVELRTNSNSTPDSEDEHGLIAQYCQSLSSSDAPFPVPKSPLQIMASVESDQKDELEQMIKDLEDENRALQAEYERLKQEQQPEDSAFDESMGQRSEAEMLAEAKLLREHKGRLEARMSILEDHNRQLEAQLQRLRQLLVEQQSGMGSPNKSGTLQTKSVTASQLAMDSPAKINGHSMQGKSTSYEGLDQMSDYVRPPPPPVGNIAHMGNLFSRAGDLEKAVGSLVASMNQETENGLPNKTEENDYDNTVNESN